MLEIRTLGGLSIRRDGAPVPAFVSRKVDALLVYLSCTQREHPREALADLLWDEDSAGDTLANLRTVISSLRRNCGSYITVGRHSISIRDPGEIWLDTVALERSLAEVRAQIGPGETALRRAMAQVEQALDLYKGDFLAGFSTRNSMGFEEWLRAERHRLRGRLIEGLRQIIPHYFSIRQDIYNTAIHHASTLTQLDPLDEEAHRQLMLLLARGGQRRESLQQYEVCRRLLERELGVEPSPETIQLREDIEHSSIWTPISRPPQHNLPAILPPLLGRERELVDITDLLANPRCRLITLYGPGGAGKTCLALHVATGHIGIPHNGVYFMQMASPGSLNQLVASLQNMLRLYPQDRRTSRPALMQYLADRELLLVFDQMESLPAIEELIVDILQHAPGVKLLVTSRARLRLHEEWAYKLGGLAYRPEGDENQLPEGYNAVQMFVDAARRTTGRPAWSDQEMQAIDRICRLVDGLPLAIEHATSWLHILSCEEIARELEKNLDLLTTTLQDMPTEHKSMLAILDASWATLSIEEQIAVRKLSDLHGSFGREEAANAAGASLNILSALTEKSVLNRGTAGDYQLSRLLRRYVRQKYGSATENGA